MGIFVKGYPFDGYLPDVSPFPPLFLSYPTVTLLEAPITPFLSTVFSFISCKAVLLSPKLGKYKEKYVLG